MNDDWDYGDYDLIIKQAQRDLDALRAENAKLREALQEISRYLENPDTQFAVPMIDIVRAALA